MTIMVAAVTAQKVAKMFLGGQRLNHLGIRVHFTGK